MKYQTLLTSLLVLSGLAAGYLDVSTIVPIAAAQAEITPTAEPVEAAEPEASDETAEAEAAETEAAETEAAETAQPKATPTDRNTVIQSQKSIEWIPLARINPAQPVTIELNNTSNDELEYLITTHTNFRTLAPGQKASIIVTDFPAFVNINAKRSVGVKYLMRVQGNKIMVDLKLTTGQGDTTLNIHEQGAIYLY
ncbi:MAG: hypothetical protein HC805_04145 [Alkalinema sp. RL_2_19]|nr:hypothetical protein [Alkalinema sp. RL_2_19]